MTARNPKAEAASKIVLVAMSVLAVPAIAWAFGNTQQNTERIIRLEAQQESMLDLLQEVREDVKVLLEKVK